MYRRLCLTILIVFFCSNSTCDRPCTIYAPNGKIYLCHVPPGNIGNPEQLILPRSAVNWHLSNHPEDKVGLCGQNCAGVKVESNIQNISPMEISATPQMSALIYPNPTSNSFNLRFSRAEPKAFSLNVFSLEGKLVYSMQKSASVSEVNFGNTLAPGTYFVELKLSNKREMFKLIKLN